jgi:cell wall-associated NlpC family hydrolase
MSIRSIRSIRSKAALLATAMLCLPLLHCGGADDAVDDEGTEVAEPEAASSEDALVTYQANKVIAAARSQLGKPYVWGGGNKNGPTGSPKAGFDCSGLMVYSFWQGDRDTLPRVTYDQYAKVGKKVPYSQRKPGDLVFYHYTKGKGPEHVALYIGSNKIIEAPHTGDVVKQASVTLPGTPLSYVVRIGN